MCVCDTLWFVYGRERECCRGLTGSMSEGGRGRQVSPEAREYALEGERRVGVRERQRLRVSELCVQEGERARERDREIER